MTPLAPLSALDPAGFRPIHAGWELAATAPGACVTPESLASARLEWHPATVPGTVAQSLDLPLDADPGLDDRDWWYRTTFDGPALGTGLGQRLRFEGLATKAEIWLNGLRVLETCNMFRPHACDVTGQLRKHNELVICFRALGPLLAARKPRPRWKAALVSHQNLRWLRTTLLGRIPGWTPPLPAVGPWKTVGLEILSPLHPTMIHLRPTVVDAKGRLQARVTFCAPPGTPPEAWLELGDGAFPLAVAVEGGEVQVTGDFEVPDVPLWFPHTHGTPHRLPCAIRLGSGPEAHRIDCGKLGFRSLTVNRADGGLRFEVNGRPVFVRGACWTAVDLRSLEGSPEALREALTLARDAGLNMLRVGGTMTYGSEAFLEACDDLGLLVWQDFMFANLDYPFEDPEFRAEVEAEVAHQLNRLAPHACLAVLCGGSEIEQQAAMLGLPAGDCCPAFLSEALPALCEAALPGTPYFSSTPTGGALPFHTATGITHYYGVGAYRRDLGDVRRSGVKFTPECLGFSNVPEQETMDLILDGARPVPHHPRWKAGVPRDQGAGWDFEDVRDHYLGLLFRLDPVALRCADLDRYWALSRLVTGEVMLRVFAEWRRPGSGCGGGLVWFYKDLRPGAGWGLLDSGNRPKAAYWFLKRAWAPRVVLITEEGLDGLDLHVLNESAEPLDATVELECLQDGRTRAVHGTANLHLEPFSAQTLSGDALLGHFTDLVHAYRFGPPKHDVVIARLREATTGAVLHEDVFFPGGMNLPFQHGAKVEFATQLVAPDRIDLTLNSDVLLQGVTFDCPTDRPEDNFFHLTPGVPRTVRFLPRPGQGGLFKVRISAVNVRETWTVRCAREG